MIKKKKIFTKKYNDFFVPNRSYRIPSLPWVSTLEVISGPKEDHNKSDKTSDFSVFFWRRNGSTGDYPWQSWDPIGSLRREKNHQKNFFGKMFSKKVFLKKNRAEGILSDSKIAMGSCPWSHFGTKRRH